MFWLYRRKQCTSEVGEEYESIVILTVQATRRTNWLDSRYPVQPYSWCVRIRPSSTRVQSWWTLEVLMFQLNYLLSFLEWLKISIKTNIATKKQ